MNLTFREAEEKDLVALVTLLHDDDLKKGREDPTLPLQQSYLDAFRSISKDANHKLILAELQGELVGTMQLSFIPGISRRGMWRGQVENVRIATKHRSKGYGAAMMNYAVRECKRRQCGLLQLTTDVKRERAHQFYERLGLKHHI